MLPILMLLACGSKYLINVEHSCFIFIALWSGKSIVMSSQQLTSSGYFVKHIPSVIPMEPHSRDTHGGLCFIEGAAEGLMTRSHSQHLAVGSPVLFFSAPPCLPLSEDH